MEFTRKIVDGITVVFSQFTKCREIIRYLYEKSSSYWKKFDLKFGFRKIKRTDQLNHANTTINYTHSKRWSERISQIRT